MENRHTLLFVLTLVCCFLISCGKEEISYKNEYVFGTDQQFYMFSNFVNKARIQETEDGCVLCHDDFVYFFNEKSGSFMPLCSKGNCLHDHETDQEKRKECHACLEDYDGIDISLMLYKDWIYIAYLKNTADVNDDKYCVCRMALDGSSKEEVFTSQDLIYPAVHRGYLYYFRYGFTAESDTIMRQIYFCRRSIENGRHEEEVILMPEKGHGCSGIQAFGKYVYLTTLRNDGAEMITSVYDTETQRVIDMPLDFRKYTALGGYTFYFSENGGEYTSSDLYRCDAMGGSENLVLKKSDIPENVSLGFDGRYFYLCTMLTDSESNTSNKRFLIYDKDFKKVDEITVPKTDSFMYDSPVGGMDHQYLLFDDPESNEWGIYVWDKSDIGTLNGKTYTQKRICYEQNGIDIQPSGSDSTESESSEKRIIDGVEIPDTQLDQSVSSVYSEMSVLRMASLDQWTEADKDTAMAFTESADGETSLSIEFTDSTITAELTYNHTYENEAGSVEVQMDDGQTVIVEVPEYIIIGEYKEKTIYIEGYFIKDDEVYSCSMHMTAKNTESPDVFTMQLPEGADKFIGANAYAQTVYKAEKTTREDIENHYPTQIGSLSGTVNRVYAGRTSRK